MGIFGSLLDRFKSAFMVLARFWVALGSLSELDNSPLDSRKVDVFVP